MSEIQIVDSTARDGVQSLWAMRLTAPELLAIAPTMDEAGFKVLDSVGGPAVFSYYPRFLNEDPWERLRLIRKAVKKTPLQVWMRTRGITGFSPAPEPFSVAKLWVTRLIANGMGRLCFNEDENNYSNLNELVKLAREVGDVKMMAVLQYAPSPVHTDEYYAGKAREAVESGVDVIEIKDAGGLLTPERTRTLVPAIKKSVNGEADLEFQTHCTIGMGLLSTLEAIKLGIKTVRGCLPPLAEGTSNPNILSIIRNAKYMGYSTNLNMEALQAISEHFYYIAKKERLLIGVPQEYDAYRFEHQVPGGVQATLRWQLAQLKSEHLIDDVLKEVAQVRKDLGYPIMITPASQYIVAQATINVLSGQRYKEVSDEIIQKAVTDYVAKPPAPVDPSVLDRIMSLPRTQELLRWKPPQPSIEELRREVGEDLSDDEFLLRLAVSEEYWKKARAAGPIKTNYTRGDKPFMALLYELMQSKKRYIHVQKKDFSLTLKK